MGVYDDYMDDYADYAGFGDDIDEVRDVEYESLGMALLHQTPKAMLLTDGENEVWIPKSLLNDIPDIEVGEFSNFEVARWFAEQEGLI